MSWKHIDKFDLAYNFRYIGDQLDKVMINGTHDF